MTNTLHPEVAPTVVSISLTMDIKKKHTNNNSHHQKYSYGLDHLSKVPDAIEAHRQNNNASKKNGRRAPACSLYL